MPALISWLLPTHTGSDNLPCDFSVHSFPKGWHCFCRKNIVPWFSIISRWTRSTHESDVVVNWFIILAENQRQVADLKACTIPMRASQCIQKQCISQNHISPADFFEDAHDYKGARLYQCILSSQHNRSYAITSWGTWFVCEQSNLWLVLGGLRGFSFFRTCNSNSTSAWEKEEVR